MRTVKTSGNLLFACQDNLNNLCLLLHRFQKLAFSLKTIPLHDNEIIITIWFSNVSTLETVENDHRFRSFLRRCKVKTQIKACSFDENDMKTYSCRRGLNAEVELLRQLMIGKDNAAKFDVSLGKNHLFV